MNKTHVWFGVYETNSTDALNPEVIAQEALMILENNVVMPHLVHRDFENEIAKSGDVVNAHKPGAFVAKRKSVSEDVTVQNAEVESIPVTLNQQIHTSFLIRDGQESMAFTSLVDYFLRPAVISIGDYIDQMLAVQAYRFIRSGNVVGKLGTAATKATYVDLREKMNMNKVPMNGRNAVLSPAIEADLLNVSDFVNANTVGDNGTSLRSGHLGQLLGINTFMDQNMPSVSTGQASVDAAGAINLSAGYAAGTTDVVVDGFSIDIPVGSWVTIAGDMVPQCVTAVSGSPTTGLTLSPGLKSAVVNDAVITLYGYGEVAQAVAPTGYAAGYVKDIVVDGFTTALGTGQMFSTAASTAAGAGIYGALGTPTTVLLTPDRPLDAALADNADLFIGPPGNYSFAFHREALGLISRPLALPMAGTGARAAIVNYNGLSMRVVITYSGVMQGHLVTVDMLCGTAVYNQSLGCVILA
jgi:hypothetical protein